MWHDESLDGEWFEKLAKIDERIAIAVAAARCPRCGGPLHRGNYQRKPRGGRIGPAGEAFTLRHSLCCGRRGCRKRALPPSLRFLGRRVYLEAVVVIATVHAMLAAAMRAAQDITGVPARTLRRWRSAGAQTVGGTGASFKGASNHRIDMPPMMPPGRPIAQRIRKRP
jgi:hypothetical protein